MSSITDHCCQGQTLVDRIRLWGETDGETPAFIFWGEARRRQLSRAQVLDLSSRFASRLRQHGVLPGEVVCICLPSCPERVVAEFGVQLAGAVSMNGQMLRADGEDFIDSLQKSKCVAVVLNRDVDNRCWEICRRHLASTTRPGQDVVIPVSSSSIPSLTAVFHLSESILSELKEEPYVHKARSVENIATIFTTSGSTGYPKLVPHSHRDLSMTGLTGTKVASAGEKTLNISHFGLLSGYPYAYLYAGAIIVKLDYSSALSDQVGLVREIIQKENIRHVCLPQDVFVHAMTLSGKRPALLTAMIGGVPLKQATLDELGRSVQTICFKYASTEAGPISEVEINKSNVGKLSDWMVGKPHSHIKIKVVDADLKEMSPMARGEVLVRTPALCPNYIGHKTESSFLPGGWFRTGDVGYLREDGCLFVEGRSSDAIMHGSYILYPGWLEQQLALCPGVAEVVIVPVPDPLLHHEICACVKIDTSVNNKPTTEDIINFCKKQLVLQDIPNLNVVPKYVLFFQEFPQTSTYKISRRLVADMARRQLNL